MLRREPANDNERGQNDSLLWEPYRRLVHVHLFPCASLLDPHSRTAVCPSIDIAIRYGHRSDQITGTNSGIAVDLHFQISKLIIGLETSSN